jgi:hypothetical protein
VLAPGLSQRNLVELPDKQSKYVLLTRDPGIYRTYFPTLEVLAPPGN